VNAAQGGKWGGENYVLPYKDLFEFSPLCVQRGMHTHLARHWLTTLETHFALQPVTPDLGDKGLVCWCAGRAGPDVDNGRAGHVFCGLLLQKEITTSNGKATWLASGAPEELMFTPPVLGKKEGG
jgi:hypothetical protein